MTIFTNRIGRRVMRAMLATSVTVAASTSFAATSNTSMLPRYDGMWSVSIVTEKGSCDRGYRYPIRISNGVLVNAGDLAFTITGKVTPNGAITVTVAHGSSSANGIGRLAGNIGEGSWSGGECSGTWTAERRGA